MQIALQVQFPEMPDDMKFLYQSMIKQIEQIKSLHEGDLLITYTNCIEVVQKAIAELRSLFLEKDQSQIDLVIFFKYIKPQFFSHLIFYSKLYQIEINKPDSGIDELAEYFMKNLNPVKSFERRNKEFIRYYRCGATFLDSDFFLPGKKQLLVYFNPFYSDADQSFSTSHEHKVALMLSHLYLKDFLIEEIKKLKNQEALATATTSFKVQTPLSVANLACLIRVFYEEKIFSTTNQTELLNFFASNFSTQKQEQISSTSLRSKYYNIETSSLENIKDLFFQMINRLKKL